MPQIDHIIYLMLENRSFDNVLGWLYRGTDSPAGPLASYPEGSPLMVDGLTPGAHNTVDGRPVYVHHGTQSLPEPLRQPRFDPHEGIGNVYKQLYDDGWGMTLDGGRWGPDAPMSGFAYDFPPWGRVEDAMGAYDRSQLPVMYGLAENFGVSDRYFASVPTMTDPNRAFSIIGTSHGRTSDVPEEPYFGPTFFGSLINTKSWSIYWQNRDLTLHPLETPAYPCETVMRFDGLGAIPSVGQRVHPYPELLETLRAGTGLADFSYVEPYWGAGLDPDDGLGFIGVQGNDYHPPTWVGPAEWYLNELYVTLRSSGYWEKTLLIVNFDEHGGTYDHVSPTQTVAPDAAVAENGFRFDRLGVRVPMLLISPYVQKGLVFRAKTTGDASAPQADLDHTSTIATILKWTGVDPAEAGLGDRVAVAPTWEGAVSDTIVQPGAVGGFTLPPSYLEQAPLGLHLFPDDVDFVFTPHDMRLACAEASTREEVVERLCEIVADRERSAQA